MFDCSTTGRCGLVADGKYSRTRKWQKPGRCGYPCRPGWFLYCRLRKSAAAIALQTLESFADEYEYYDYTDSNSVDPDVCDEAGALIHKIIDDGRTGDGLKRFIAEELDRISWMEVYTDYDMFDMDALVADVSERVLSKEDVLKMIDTHLSTESEYRLADWVHRRVTLLTGLGRMKDAEYRRLKKLVSADEWPEYLDRLIDHTKLCDYSSYAHCSQAEIFKEEKEYDRLLNLIANLRPDSRLEALMRYSEVLKDMYSKQLLEMFVPLIKDYAEKNVNVKAYPYVVQVLRQMRRLNGGAEAVSGLVALFRQKYIRRSRMMRELDKL